MSVQKNQLRRFSHIISQLKENRYPNSETLIRDFNRMALEENIDISCVHHDCGMMIFDLQKQKDVGAGGSGCGCSGAVVCSEILQRIENSELKKVFFVGTGALMSSVSSLQSESIPGVAHGVLISGGDLS